MLKEPQVNVGKCVMTLTHLSVEVPRATLLRHTSITGEAEFRCRACHVYMCGTTGLVLALYEEHRARAAGEVKEGSARD